MRRERHDAPLRDRRAPPARGRGLHRRPGPALRDLGDDDPPGPRLPRVRGPGPTARAAGRSTCTSRAYEPPIHQRAQVQADAKRAIGEAAALMVRDDETVILDIGTTTAAMARAMRADLSATVVTHSLLIAGELADPAGVRTLVTGGVLRPGELTPDRPATPWTPSADYNCDTLFLGVAGVDLDKGLTEIQRRRRPRQARRGRRGAPRGRAGRRDQDRPGHLRHDRRDRRRRRAGHRRAGVAPGGARGGRARRRGRPRGRGRHERRSA